MISTPQFIWMVLAALWGVALPMVVLLWWRRTRRVRLMPALVGELAFVLSALVLEPMLHRFVLQGDHALARAVNGSVWLYALYGGLAAGVFEETARLLSFRFALKKHTGRDTAVTYGIGHGGIEMILMLTGTYVGYLVAAAAMNGGDPTLLAQLAGGNAEALKQLTEIIAALTPGTIVLAMLERLSALILQISLSIFVFIAARDRTRRRYYPLAILFHALIDLPAALYQRGVLPLATVEVLFAVCALYLLRSARKRYLEMTDP